MSTHLSHVVVDANDPGALARFWAIVLDWPIVIDDPHEVEIGPGSDGDIPLIFVPATTPKVTKNRIHIDICRSSPADQVAFVERVRTLGASPVDIGQGDAAHWDVLADPEGNEFCVSGQPDYGETETGSIAGFSFDAGDARAQGRFWHAATGWDIVTEDDWGGVGLRSPEGKGPFIAIWPSSDQKRGKNRLHIDVRPEPVGDPLVEADRLVALGATRIDIGQHDVPWIVLADPEGNEFCVLSPAGDG